LTREKGRESGNEQVIEKLARRNLLSIMKSKGKKRYLPKQKRKEYSENRRGEVDRTSKEKEEEGG